MRRIAALTICCALPLASVAGVDASDMDELSQLPVLPVSVVKAAEKADTLMPAAANEAAQAHLERSPVAMTPEAASQSVADGQSSRLLMVKPGLNEIIPISLGHPNRILMPFDDPKIRTTSSAGFDIEGRVVYVTSNEEGRPVTAFVSDASNPELALSLTFVAKRMPPVDVELQLENQNYATGGFRPSQKAKAWEQSQPYLNTLRDLLRAVANGETPQGYTLSESPNLQDFGGCRQPGLSFEFAQGQVLEGHRLRVNVGVVTNVSGQTVEFREPACAAVDVKAVATWPNPLLQPGQKSEVYVVRSIEARDKPRLNARRSLLQE